MSQSSTPKKTRKVINANQSSPTKKLSQKDMHSSCFRLSRVPEKYKSNRIVQQEEQQPFVQKYFGANPDQLDTRTPEEKLQSIEEQLEDENLENKERFRLMAQKRQLNLFVHGEDSEEMMRTEKDLGMYYNQNKRPQSAFRHLSKAYQLEEGKEVSEEEQLVIAVEAAEASINMRNKEKKQETIRNLSQAMEMLKSVKDIEPEDKHMKARRDLSMARILALRAKFKEAIEQYDVAIISVEDDYGKESEETANVYVEMGSNAAYADEMELSRSLYRTAYDIYKKCGNDEFAETLVPKFTEPKAEGEEEEEEAELNDENYGEEEEGNESSFVVNAGLDNTIQRNTNSPNSELGEERKSGSDHESDNEHERGLNSNNPSTPHSPRNESGKLDNIVEDKLGKMNDDNAKNSSPPPQDRPTSGGKGEQGGKAEKLINDIGSGLLG